MIDMEIKVQYFNGRSLKPVEFTTIHLTDAKTLDEAREAARRILEVHKSTAYDNGAIMDTFYYEYDFLVPADMVE